MSTTQEDRLLVVRAYQNAQKRRPYVIDDDLVIAVVPRGGEWSVEIQDRQYVVMWGTQKVCTHTGIGGGEVAMGIRATPAMDAALRAILVLAEDRANAPLIKKIATSVIAYVEMAAPRPPDDDPADAEECSDE